MRVSEELDSAERVDTSEDNKQQIKEVLIKFIQASIKSTFGVGSLVY